MQHLMQKVPPPAWPAFKALVADMRDAPTFEEGQRRLQHLLDQYQGTFPEACRCLPDDAEASLNHLKVAPRYRQYMRTSHLAEWAFEEERHRTKVIPHLWAEASLVQRVFAVLIRVRSLAFPEKKGLDHAYVEARLADAPREERERVVQLRAWAAAQRQQSAPSEVPDDIPY
jgi:transposase-like protein